MKLLQRISAMVLAAVLAVSPALACGGFCTDHIAGPEQTSADASAHEGCAEAARAAQRSMRLGHADCAGSVSCAEKHFKAQAMAKSAAASISAPEMIFLYGPLLPTLDTPNVMKRPRLTPPSAGPPHALTPVSLKTLLRV